MGVFGSEKAMKEVAVDSLPRNLRGDSTRVLTEFEYSTGRADIVLIDFSEAYWERRVEKLNLTTPIRNEHHLRSFLQLHGRDPITPEYFLGIGALERNTKLEALDWLISNGFVEELNDGRVRTAKRFRRHITTSVSVELKLSKWKEALKQAKRGSSFTEYQFVAIDEDHVHRALANIDSFIEANVGLLSLDESGKCTIYHHPDRGSPLSVLHQWRLNERSLEKMA